MMRWEQSKGLVNSHKITFDTYATPLALSLDISKLHFLDIGYWIDFDFSYDIGSDISYDISYPSFFGYDNSETADRFCLWH